MATKRVTEDTPDMDAARNTDTHTARGKGVTTKSEGDKQKLYVVRHGQRIDFTFGKDWIEKCVDEQGRYVRFDMNMPPSLYERAGGVHAYKCDSPLTMLGQTHAKQLGEALSARGISFAHIYSSPALRCVQTAFHILQGMGCTDKPILIEPGLFEWLAWHPGGLPKFMTIAELQDAGFKVIGHDFTAGDATTGESQSHSSIWKDWNLKESLTDYYNRADMVTREVLNRQSDNGHFLLVAHKGSVDVCTRQLVGKEILTPKLFKQYVQTVPYCAVACCQKNTAQQTADKPIRVASQITSVPKSNRAVQRPVPKLSSHRKPTIVIATPNHRMGMGGTIGQNSDHCWSLCDPMLPSFSNCTVKKYDWRIWQ